MHHVVRRLCKAALRPEGDCATDSQLLEAFVARHEQAAFATLLRRHGPMVLGVCRRVLGDLHDAEDAFQATFLVLLRKAGGLRSRALLANWLYGVAYRTARKARVLNAKRRCKEQQAVKMLPQPSPADDRWEELLPHLDAELSRLPDKYREPVVLCDLQGKSRKDAARQLRLAEGTLSSRLATARRRLAGRLGRHGVALPAGTLAAFVGHGGASAAVPPGLAVSTTRAAVYLAAGQIAAAGAASLQAVALAEGVMKMMLLAKLKTVSAFAIGVAVIGLTTGGLCWQSPAGAADDRGAAGSKIAVAQQRERRDPDGRDDELRALRERLEAALREVRELRAEADRHRQQADAARARADEAVRAAQQRADEGLRERQRAERLYERARDEARTPQRPAEQQFYRAQQPGQPVQGQQHTPASSPFDQDRGRLMQSFEQQRQELLSRLHDLEAKQRQALESLDRRRADSRRQGQNPNSVQRPTDGDKLDRILQRLEQIEQRLNRLEGRRP